MKLHNKKYFYNLNNGLDHKNIENMILESGYKPLRWAIISISEDVGCVDAVVIEE